MRFSDPRQASSHSSGGTRWLTPHRRPLNTASWTEKCSLRDEGLSACHQRHIESGALDVFLVTAEQGRIPTESVLVVEGLDRLSRAEPIQALAQLAQIINAGTTLVTASDGKQYSREQIKANPMDLVYSLLVVLRTKGPVPHLLTGIGITICGDSGRALVGQNSGTRNRDELGGIQPGHRRLHCTSCSVGGSVSV